MISSNLLSKSLASIVLFGAVAAANAVTFTFTPATQNVNWGDTATFDYSFTNDTGSDITYASSYITELSTPDANITTNDHAENWPISPISSGATVGNGTTPLVTVDIATGATLGTHTYSYTMVDSNNNQYTANFSVNVVPEPVSGVVLAAGVGMAALRRRRARK